MTTACGGRGGGGGSDGTRGRHQCRSHKIRHHINHRIRWLMLVMFIVLSAPAVLSLIAGCGDESGAQATGVTGTETSDSSDGSGSGGSGASTGAQTGATAPAPTGLTLLKTIEIPGAARPEIVEANDRVYVIYLEPTPSGNFFKVKIYDRDLAREIGSRTLVAGTPAAKATDIRVVKGGDGYLYAFYEEAGTSESRLYGVKYRLDDNLSEVATRGPLAVSTSIKVAKDGDEKLDDPAPLVAGDGIYVMTRYKDTLAPEGSTRYKLRRLDRDLNLAGEFDLDLSTVADGGARQASVIASGSKYYLATATTTGPARDPSAPDDIAWVYPSDIILVTFDSGWQVTGSQVIASDAGYTDAYVTGLQASGSGFVATYNQAKLPAFSSVINGFDAAWRTSFTDIYKTVSGGGGLRPSLEVSGDRLYAGNDEQKDIHAEIYLFQIS